MTLYFTIQHRAAIYSFNIMSYRPFYLLSPLNFSTLRKNLTWECECLALNMAQSAGGKKKIKSSRRE